MTWLKQHWLKVFLVSLPVILSLLFWKQIPNEVPIHWNISGEPDGYSSKYVGLFIWPVLMLFTYGLFKIIPIIDPKKNVEQFQLTLDKLANLMGLFYVGMFGFMLSNYLGFEVQTDRWILMGISLLFLVLGNYFGKFRPNYFVGIRTPWTLESEEIWRKTHRMAGKLWVIASFLMLIILIFFYSSWGVFLFIIYATVISLIPIGYSFWLFRQEDSLQKS